MFWYFLGFGNFFGQPLLLVNWMVTELIITYIWISRCWRCCWWAIRPYSRRHPSVCPNGQSWSCLVHWYRVMRCQSADNRWQAFHSWVLDSFSNDNYKSNARQMWNVCEKEKKKQWMSVKRIVLFFRSSGVTIRLADITLNRLASNRYNHCTYLRHPNVLLLF